MAKQTDDQADEKAPEMVTVYHPDPRAPEAIKSRQVPKDRLDGWKAQGWLDAEPKSDN